MPKVTVVIPTYNYARFLGEAIQSVLDQTFTDFELVVVDDGSTDNTREVVGSFKDPRVRYIYQEHRGVSVAQNTGHKASVSEYITGLGADDSYLPQNLELKVKVLDARPELALVCSDAWMIDGRTGSILGKYWHGKPFNHSVDPRRAAQQPLKELLYREFFITPQATLIRRKVIDEVGLFDESLPTHEDWDLFFRIVQRFPIETIDIPLIKMKHHDANLSKNRTKRYLGAVGALNKAINSKSLYGANLKHVKKRLARTHFSYGKSMILNGDAAMGREKLLAAIKVSPWYIKPYVYLAGSLLGDSAILSLKSLMKRFA
jgi:glycosyltransferase involved in cell wall biosynthesis